MNISPRQIGMIRNYFAKQPVLKAYLFGSVARGEATAASDIDILLELDYSQPIGLEFIQMQIDLQELLRRKVDLVSARGLSKYIQPEIDKEKKLIYVSPLAGKPFISPAGGGWGVDSH
ncbi:MAG: nucleotidyltransferase [Bacteroidetes bacterium]|nr:MAG: nucleotidyltransferase [Bacteroidota bacterium]